MTVRKPQNQKLLGVYGRKKWKVLSPLLPPNATDTDWDLVESYCLNWQLTTQAASEIREHGSTVINSAGSRQANPANALFNATQKQLIILSKELNLTALAQHRNQIESTDDDGWDQV